MKTKLLFIFLSLILTSCKSGIGAKERMGWYVPFVPNDLNVVEFYETPVPSMDYEYMWKIKTENTANYRKFEKQFTTAPPNVDGVNNYDSVSVFDDHPNWWKKIDFKKGVLHKHRVLVVGSGGGEWADIFALVDAEGGFYLFSPSPL